MANYNRLVKNHKLLLSGAAIALAVGISSYITGSCSSGREDSYTPSSDACTQGEAKKKNRKDKQYHRPIVDEDIETTLQGEMGEEAERYKPLVFGAGQGRVTFYVEERALKQIEKYIHIRRLNGHGQYSRDDLARLLYALDGNGNNHVGEHEVEAGEYVKKEREKLMEKYRLYDTNFKLKAKPEKQNDEKPEDTTFQ